MTSMHVWTDTFLVLLVILNLSLLGSSRLGAATRRVAAQGILLGLFTLVLHMDRLTIETVAMTAGMIGLKGIVFPWLLFRALREAEVRREVEPYVGYSASLLFGVLAFGLSLWLGSRLPLPGGQEVSLIVPAGLFTILVGLFLIVARRKALNQVLGYLVLENGIYAFGVALLPERPLLVELGILLDVFVGVFVMGIMIFHIQREFDHIDADRLSSLKD
ncbi:MAG: hydrogenase [Planctomycetes bacterium]|nr:hydrogenase [Planctomycetota bacterium]